jgi:hypothetical protein
MKFQASTTLAVLLAAALDSSTNAFTARSASVGSRQSVTNLKASGMETYDLPSIEAEVSSSIKV